MRNVLCSNQIKNFASTKREIERCSTKKNKRFKAIKNEQFLVILRQC
jgi:hypothetical protein